MKIKSLTLKGVTVFKDQITVPFGELPAGLIAIVGPNGAGKSTLMESILAALYREMPSRTGSLYDNTYGKDAFFDLLFDIDGHEYRSKVLVNAQSETQKAFVEMDGKPLDECKQGKLDPHGKAIERIVGSKRLILSSVFSAQTKAGDFGKLAVSERKALFTELLGLGQYPGYASTCKLAREAGTGTLTMKRMYREQMEKDAARYEEIQLKLVEREVAGVELQSQIAQAAALLAERDADIAELNQRIATAAATLEAQDKELTARYGRAKPGYDAAKKRLNAFEDERRARRATLEAEREKIHLEIANIKTRIQNNELLIDNAETYRAAAEESAALAITLGALDDELQQAYEHERAHHEYAVTLRTTSIEIARVKEDMADIETAAEELDRVPCHGEGPYASCVKIVKATQGRQYLPDLTLRREALLSQKREYEALLNGRSGHRPTSDIAALKLEAQRRRDSLQTKVQAAGQLESAAERLAERQRMLEMTKERLHKITTQLDESDPAGLELHRQVVSLEAEMEAIQKERAQMETRTLSTLRNHLKGQVESRSRVQAGLESLQNELLICKSAVHGYDTEQLRLQPSVDRLPAMVAEIGALERELNEWSILERACGPAGVPALAIDAAGPAISADVNDLLSSCFSGRFSVQLTTQRAAADGKKMLEDFDLRVIDAERARSGPLDTLSGGEKVVVSEALGMAIAIYNKSGHRLQTCFRDETTGSLDVDNAPRYVAMLRRALAVGGFHQIIFVTHSPECAELADARLRCGNGKVMVEL